MRILSMLFLIIFNLQATQLLRLGNTYQCIESLSVVTTTSYYSSRTTVYYYRSDTPNTERSSTNDFEVFDNYEYKDGICQLKIDNSDVWEYVRVVQGLFVVAIFIWALV
jgi:hypothetical protein